MTKPIHLLLVEDNPADVDLTRESLDSDRLHLNIHTAMDGDEALKFLRQEAPFESSPRPDIILLDLNLPKRDGREVLAKIKTDENTRRIPVVVLTSSDAEMDVIKSYDLGANCYIKKPVDFEQFQHVVKSLENFWFTVVKLADR